MRSSAGNAGNRGAEWGSREEALASALNSAAIHLLRRIRASDAALGISPSRLSALSVVVFGGPLSPGALAAAEQVTPPSMTRTVAALEAEGLVVRAPDPADRRSVVIRATPKGRRVMLRGRRLRVQSLARELRRLSAEERATLEAAAAILERLEAESGPGTRAASTRPRGGRPTGTGA